MQISGLIAIPDVRRIPAKMSRIYYLVGCSHFADCRENLSVTVWEINLLKSAIPQWWRKWKN